MLGCYSSHQLNIFKLFHILIQIHKLLIIMVSSGVQVLGTNYSPFVSRVRIALNLKSVNFEYIEQNLTSKSDLLLGSNPVYKKVPVLIHGDTCICESLVIVQYIDETWTGNGHSILPSDAYDRAVARVWAAYFDDKVH